MARISKKIDGKHVIMAFSASSDYPGMKKMAEISSKHGYDPATFRLAVRDWWDGLWESSQYRSDKCDLEAHQLTRKGMIWYRRIGVHQEKSGTPSKPQRRSRVAMARSGGFTLATIMMEQLCKCAACGCDLIEFADYQLDHIQPISKGGCDKYWNLQFLCLMCNASKSAKDPFVWSAQTGTKLPEKFLARFKE